VTRWREDAPATTGARSSISDTASGSSGPRVPADAQETGDVRGDILGGEGGVPPRDHEFDMHTEIAVSPRTTPRCAGSASSTLPDTQDDRDHELRGSGSRTAFRGRVASGVVNLFVQTEIVRQRQAILCTRRPRSFDEPTRGCFT